MTVRVLLLDTETTGLGEHDEPISIGLVRLIIDEKSGKECGERFEYHGLRKPAVKIHPKAQQVHGIDAQSLEGKDFEHHIVRSEIEQADWLIAHNAAFDRKMLQKMYPSVHQKRWYCSYRQWPWPSSDSKKLDAACALLEVYRPKVHGALADAQALCQCLLKHTGKTERSKTYLSALLSKSPMSFYERQRTESPKQMHTTTYHFIDQPSDELTKSPKQSQKAKPKTPWVWVGAFLFFLYLVFK
jgi:DNA polymerase III subunit epsilon